MSASTLTDAISFVVDKLEQCHFDVCKRTRWQGEPLKLMCCDCNAAEPGYTVVGWIMRSYDADPSLREAASFECAVLGATEVGLTVARCWPVRDTMSADDTVFDEVAGELERVKDCLDTAFCRCDVTPGDFRYAARKFAHSGFRPRNTSDETPYGPDGTVRYACAGWQFSITVA